MDSKFTFRPVGDAPVFSIAPCSTRMVTAYEDRVGRYHIFTDVCDHERDTPFENKLDSWDAEIGYYSSPDLKSFTDHGVVVEKGRWSGDPATSDLDCVGVASPGVTVAGDKVLLFHAGRGPVDPAGPFQPTLDRADLPGQVFLSVADADENGAPAGPFVKQGPITDFGAPWRSIRHDDPCPVATEDEVLVFYKGIGSGKAYGNRVAALARAPIDRPAGPYTLHPDPVLSAPSGGEIPRVFRVGETWHMFYVRYAADSQLRGRVFGHYTATDPTEWTLVDDRLYESESPKPGQGAADMCPIWSPFAPGPPKLAFAARLDDGTYGDAGRLKQWLFEIQQE